MAEDPVEVLVLRDAEGNVYALPRRVVERARVPEELKDALPLFQRSGRRYWPSTLSTTPPAQLGVGPSERPPHFLTRVTAPQLPWPIGWVRMP
jgi:hypothetical protein